MHKDRSVADLHASKNNGSGDNQCFSLFIRGVLGGSSRKPGFVGIAAEHGNAPEVDIPSFGYANFDAAEDASDFEVTLEITCIFGGVESRVPERWNVHFRSIPVLGGYSDKTRLSAAPSQDSTNEKRKTLIITGAVIFGGVEIGN